MNMPVILEKPTTLGIGDPEASTVGEDEKGLLAPEEIEEEHLEGCFVEFLTWTVNFKTKRSYHGKRIDYGGATADPFWIKMTLEDMVGLFVINSVCVCLVYDVSFFLFSFFG